MKKWGLLSVLIIMLCSLPAVANEQTADYYDIAESYYASNNMVKALEYVELILKINPADKNARALKQKISLSQNSSKEQKAPVGQVIDIRPKYTTENNVEVIDTTGRSTLSYNYDSNYYNTKGQTYYNKGDYKSAIQYFNKAIELDRNDCKAYNNLAMAEWKNNSIDSAIKHFKTAYRKNRLYTQTLVNLADIYNFIGDYEQAEKTYLKAISINPSDSIAYCRLGDYYKAANNYPKAIKNYQQAIESAPQYSDAYLKLAISFFETEEFGYCISTLEKYSELVPDSDFADMLTAKSYSAISKYEEAQQYIDKAIAINNCLEYKTEKAKNLYNLGEYLQAQKEFEEIIQNKPSAAIYNYLGLCHYKQKDIDKAMLFINKAISEDPYRPIYYYNLAQCFKSLNDKTNYTKNVKTATKLKPQNCQDYIDLSYIYFDNSNPAYALNTLNDAIKAYPNAKSLYLSKLHIYEIIGDNINYSLTRNIIEKKFNNYEKSKKEKE